MALGSPRSCAIRCLASTASRLAMSSSKQVRTLRSIKIEFVAALPCHFRQERLQRLLKQEGLRSGVLATHRRARVADACPAR